MRVAYQLIQITALIDKPLSGHLQLECLDLVAVDLRLWYPMSRHTISGAALDPNNSIDGLLPFPTLVS